MENVFESKSMSERSKMSNMELMEYYKSKRKEDFANGKKLKLVKTRKYLHMGPYALLFLKRNLEKQKYYTLYDRRTKTKRPVIYAVKHIGKSDIEMASEAIKEHFYILFADPEQVYRTVEHYFLEANGVIYFDIRDKEDCNIAKERIIELLNKRINIFWCPEGTWDLTPARIVLPMHFGIIETALKTNALICPVGIEQYDNKYVVNFNDYLDVNDYKEQYPDETALKVAAIEDLRSSMATMIWEIWEQFPIEKRENIPADFYEKYVKDHVAAWPAFELDNIMSRVYNRINGKKVDNLEEVMPKAIPALSYKKN